MSTSDNFYLNFELMGDNLLLRSICNGVRSKQRIPVMPNMYLETEEDSEFKNIFGQNLIQHPQSGCKVAREFIKSYSGSTTVYGFNRFQYDAIDDLYPGTDGVGYNQSLINVLYVDVETECADGFPSIEKGDQVVNAITMSQNGEIYTLGLKDVDKSKLPENTRYVNCKNETNLLDTFLKLWRKLDPDIITGWNVTFFDLPYMAKRIEVVLGEEMVKKLSPWGKVDTKVTRVMGREQTKVHIWGVSVLDYIDIYKKFRLKMQESYKLDYIAHVELGTAKLDYSEYDSLHELYLHDYQKFIEYNIQDVLLVMQLEEKLKYIELACTIAYLAKVNYDDVYSNVRMWDVIISNYLKADGIIVNSTQLYDSSGADVYEGAYVKVPQVDKFDWVCSFDLTSLYPSLIRTYNISPDVDVNMDIAEICPEVRRHVDSDYVTDEDEVMESVTATLKEKDLTMAANGTLYRRDKKGFMAALMEQYFNYRKAYKKEMLRLQSEVQAISAELQKRGVS